MKQTLKRFMSIALMMICVFAFTACGSTEEATGIDESLSSNMTTTAEGLVDAIVVLSQEEIDAYKESGDAFTESAMEAWETNRDEVGEYVGIVNSVVDETTDGYAVTVSTEFANKKADMVFTFDDQGTPTAVAINPEYTLGEQMAQAAGNTVMGVGIVFVILVFLSFLISLFKFIPALQDKFTKKANEPAAAAPAPAAQPVAAAPVSAEITDDSELIAVIAAAIAATEGTSTDGFVVRSIKKVNRKKW